MGDFIPNLKEVEKCIAVNYPKMRIKSFRILRPEFP